MTLIGTLLTLTASSTIFLTFVLEGKRENSERKKQDGEGGRTETTSLSKMFLLNQENLVRKLQTPPFLLSLVDIHNLSQPYHNIHERVQLPLQIHLAYLNKTEPRE